MPKGKKQNKDELTLQQETFVQELIKEKSQIEAYRIAYPHTKKWTDNATYVNASRLSKEPKINLRYEELKQKLIEVSEEDTIMKAKEVLEIYTRIARGEETEEVFVNGGDGMGAIKRDKKASIKDRIKALERLDKILNLEKNNENENNIKDDGLSKQLEKVANSNIWEGLEDESED